jgi:hypothetical protein
MESPCSGFHRLLTLRASAFHIPLDRKRHSIDGIIPTPRRISHNRDEDTCAREPGQSHVFDRESGSHQELEMPQDNISLSRVLSEDASHFLGNKFATRLFYMR